VFCVSYTGFNKVITQGEHIMDQKVLTDSQKKELIQEILGTEYHQVGNHFPLFSKMIDNLGTMNDAAAISELVPVLTRYLSGTATTSVFSVASMVGILLFPVHQFINLVNANQTGHRMYSYRAIAYTIVGWAFSQPIPAQSARIILNIRSGSVVKSVATVREYEKIWRETSLNVQNQLNIICVTKNIDVQLLKRVFQVMGEGNTGRLSALILESFESQFGPTTKPIWKSNYSVCYPH